jgi:hypothetical protein
MRHKIGPEDLVFVFDLYDGDLIYGKMAEDGERPVIHQDHQAVVRFETMFGEVFELDRTFASFDEAQEMVERIQAHGSVNLVSRWSFVRTIYGSRAYESYGQAMEVAWEREQDLEDRFAARWS